MNCLKTLPTAIVIIIIIFVLYLVFRCTKKSKTPSNLRHFKPLKRQSRLADDIFKACYSYFSEVIMLDITCESSAWQTIRIKNQALFSLKNKK